MLRDGLLFYPQKNPYILHGMWKWELMGLNINNEDDMIIYIYIEREIYNYNYMEVSKVMGIKPSSIGIQWDTYGIS